MSYQDGEYHSANVSCAGSVNLTRLEALETNFPTISIKSANCKRAENVEKRNKMKQKYSRHFDKHFRAINTQLHFTTLLWTTRTRTARKNYKRKSQKRNTATRLKKRIKKTVKKEQRRKKRETYRRRCSAVIHQIPTRSNRFFKYNIYLLGSANFPLYTLRLGNQYLLKIISLIPCMLIIRSKPNFQIIFGNFKLLC